MSNQELQKLLWFSHKLCFDLRLVATNQAREELLSVEENTNDAEACTPEIPWPTQRGTRASTIVFPFILEK